MAQRVGITINLGANAPIEVVRELIDSLDAVCQFGNELQYRSAIAYAELEVQRQPRAWLSGRDFEESLAAVAQQTSPWGQRGGVTLAFPSAILAPAVSRYMRENDVSRDTTTTVESIRYSNPIEIVIGVGIVAAVVVLRTIRDWPARRRVDAAVAADIESTVTARRILRDRLLDRALESQLPLDPRHIDDLLTLDVARAMQVLGDSEFTMRELEANDTSVESH